MTETGRIGLNEVELGIPVPKFWAQLMARVIGTGVADKLCTFAQMCTPQRALEVGMLDELASNGHLLPVRTLAAVLGALRSLMFQLPLAVSVFERRSIVPSHETNNSSPSYRS